MILKFNVILHEDTIQSTDQSVIEHLYMRAWTRGNQTFHNHFIKVDSTRAEVSITRNLSVVVSFKLNKTKYKYTVASFGLGQTLDTQSKREQAEAYASLLKGESYGHDL